MLLPREAVEGKSTVFVVTKIQFASRDHIAFILKVKWLVLNEGKEASLVLDKRFYAKWADRSVIQAKLKAIRAFQVTTP